MIKDTKNMSARVFEKASKIKLLILDVDGVMTDGTVYYTNSGDEIKAFNIKDGLGIKLAQKAGIQVGIITGRSSEIVARRAAELSITPVIQGREDKEIALSEVAKQMQLDLNAIAYMGDDLPDMSAMQVVGLSLAPADSHREIQNICDWRSTKDGGRGAVREACDLLLEAKHDYQTVLNRYTLGDA